MGDKLPTNYLSSASGAFPDLSIVSPLGRNALGHQAVPGAIAI